MNIESPVFAVGLMSGTSADGVDAALIRSDGDQDFEFIDAVTTPYSDELRQRLIAIARPESDLSAAEAIEGDLTDAHWRAIESLIVQTASIPNLRDQIQVIGFHGHTIRHQPHQGTTRQLGDAKRLASQSGIAVVSDFRQQDLDHGGEGAPLAPLFHALLLKDAPKPTGVLNLGGVGNLTWLSANGRIVAGDTGPGCGLLDKWVQHHTGKRFDRDGALALQGLIHQEVVTTALQSAYFQRDFPKSADRFDFESILDLIDGLSPADGAATLCEITVAAIAAAARRVHADELQNAATQSAAPSVSTSAGSETDAPLPLTLWVTGGGSLHPLMMKRLAHYFAAARNVREAGFRPGSLEAECFAWLAVRRLRELPTSLPTTTGCRQPTCGGVITPAIP